MRSWSLPPTMATPWRSCRPRRTSASSRSPPSSASAGPGRSPRFRRHPGAGPRQLAEDPSSWTVASERPPTEEEIADLAFAWRVCKHIKSNAIVLAKDRGLLGMGAGQPNRVVSVRLALQAAAERAGGSVLASTLSFLPGRHRNRRGRWRNRHRPARRLLQRRGGHCRRHRLNLAMVFTGVRALPALNQRRMTPLHAMDHAPNENLPFSNRRRGKPTLIPSQLKLASTATDEPEAHTNVPYGHPRHHSSRSTNEAHTIETCVASLRRSSPSTCRTARPAS